MTARHFPIEAQVMLAEAGFEPCFVRDISEGDTIAIAHDTKKEAPTEMVVTELYRSRAGVIMQWIGVLPGGLKVHCDCVSTDAVWRQVAETPEADQ